MSRTAVEGTSLLLCRVGSRLCALPVDQVVETMRPLPIEPLAGLPAFVRGVSVVRGEPVPVIDLGVVVGVELATPTRLILAGVGGRRVALLVDQVLGIRAVDDDGLHQLPRLLDGVSSDAVAAWGALDSELLVLLENARLMPDAFWATFDEASSMW